ncbi:MAG: hypothetical protein H8E44_05590 [Planctomycetes bacterium]|nr:hypothetical protein [Planctomycetota bacterium]MBL7037178.1 hypothetical protein [Pirellulaceae bacterium]
MNQDHPSSEDHGQFRDDGVDPQRLADVEQRLKAARPRPAELDIEAIVRTAHAADQTVALREPPVERRGIRSYRWTIAIAGSWACGAIAGALVTFILLSRVVPPERPTDRSTAMDEELPRVVEPREKNAPDDDSEQRPRDDSPRKNVPPWSPSDSLVAVMLLDTVGHGVAPYGDEWPTLRAGALARGQGASGASRFRHGTNAAQPNRTHTPDPGSDIRQDMTPRAAPAPSITQEQLLRELLGTRPDSVL